MPWPYVRKLSLSNQMSGSLGAGRPAAYLTATTGWDQERLNRARVRQGPAVASPSRRLERGRPGPPTRPLVPRHRHPSVQARCAGHTGPELARHGSEEGPTLHAQPTTAAPERTSRSRRGSALLRHRDRGAAPQLSPATTTVPRMTPT